MCMSVLSPPDDGYFQHPNIWPSILEKGVGFFGQAFRETIAHTVLFSTWNLWADTIFPDRLCFPGYRSMPYWFFCFSNSSIDLQYVSTLPLVTCADFFSKCYRRLDSRTYRNQRARAKILWLAWLYSLHRQALFWTWKDLGKSPGRVSKWCVVFYCAQTPHSCCVGRCVLTLGTGTNSNISWRGNNLLASHSYAIIGQFSILILIRTSMNDFD